MQRRICWLGNRDPEIAPVKSVDSHFPPNNICKKTVISAFAGISLFLSYKSVKSFFFGSFFK